jgi:hypothetical protein
MRGKTHNSPSLHGEEPRSGVSNHERSTKDYQFISFVVRVHGLSPVLTMKEIAGLLTMREIAGLLTLKEMAGIAPKHQHKQKPGSCLPGFSINQSIALKRF